MKEISAKDLQEKLEKGENLHLIDVREDDEVAQGIIPGALHIRLSEIPERMNELDKDKHYYMICRSGGRSGRATEFLNEQGYHVTNMAGGMLAWEGDVQ
ncbi:rhodanese-like domain-containing protein [Oceanobacillus caeni]|uniref:Rhodanese domain protein n=1 Tax=Oceanobacillus caeni TaxID=405946 RepID=A0ABR5MIK4_9BACI|nr:MULTISPECIES: rhodanese-like domain-containing protein [Bacillaceae]KKE77645.1 rhodanese domain protein [Bacilli bacterium VT-13-104]PZD83872.1 rhodanese-like domain-containing protein [Bacilli bacterium]KPH74323.1 rhodanese domain protein [Oceanobacillus caeni]MBU8791443.1 rhodanese-like domain-containing protein [Oceanobacillus caeni]MCR1833805.1 rhodanese-like domain-containing protein [Oceanobacillus caeni]